VARSIRVRLRAETVRQVDDQGAEATLRQGVRDDDDAVPEPLEDIVAVVSWCSRAGTRARAVGEQERSTDGGEERCAGGCDVVMKTGRVSKNLRELVAARTDESGRSGLSMVISSWQGARAMRPPVAAQGSRIVGEYASTRGRRVPVVLNIWIIYACAPLHNYTANERAGSGIAA
jgi:hypothetical protein